MTKTRRKEPKFCIYKLEVNGCSKEHLMQRAKDLHAQLFEVPRLLICVVGTERLGGNAERIGIIARPGGPWAPTASCDEVVLTVTGPRAGIREANRRAKAFARKTPPAASNHNPPH
jgi:hypothetical protein